MKFKIYVSIILLSLFVVGFSIYFTQKSISQVSGQKAKELYEDRIKEYEVFLENKKIFLDSFAKFISSSNLIKQAYLENNRSLIISYVKPLYDNLYRNGLIKEIHFFKRPAISFVNFADLKTFDINVSKSRADILWISTSFSPSTHFYVCRLYPGLRATYPIIENDKLLGSVSFGIDINTFRNLFQRVGAGSVSIYLNNNELKSMLLPNKYLKYKTLPTYRNFKVIGEPFRIELKEGVEVHNNYVYSKIRIKDFFNNTMAYLVIRDDIKPSIAILKKTLTEKMIIEIVGFLLVFSIVFILFKWLFDKMKEFNNILKLIKSHKFEEIPPKTKPRDELDIYKNNLIDVAKSIKTYINLLTQKVEEYSDKVYKDGLTEILNRRFLEEKAHELFVKYTLTDTPVGIIMLDIDDFKKINDTYGHDIGDIVLIKLAQAVKRIIRKGDLFIRYGGEEFLIILPNSNIENTYKIAEKIRKEIEKLSIEINEKKLKFTISLGISEVNMLDSSLFDAIKRADINLYKAKQKGKNRVEV